MLSHFRQFLSQIRVSKHKHFQMVIHSKLADTKSKLIDESDVSLKKPDAEELHATTEATRLALEKITSAKVKITWRRFISSTHQIRLDRRCPTRSPCREDGRAAVHPLHAKSAVGPGRR